MVVVHRGKDAAILLRFWLDLDAATPSVHTDQQRLRRCRWLSRSRVGGSHIKRQSQAEAATCSKGCARVCHKAVDRSRGGSGHAGKGRASDGLVCHRRQPRLLAVVYQRSMARRPRRSSQPSAGDDGDNREGSVGKPIAGASHAQEIVYPCIPNLDREDEGGQASSSLAESSYILVFQISVAKLLQSDLATLAQREGGE
ncbi:hypothetical protein BHM03_00007267 [Ensete ventricosum]|nr:hypothetical protein BHM03_00007267 [Ensete ventricosum]